MTAPRTTPNLTPREHEVLRLMAAGLSNQQIADELEFGIDAAKIHARHIYAALNSANRADAVAQGFVEGLLTTEDIAELRNEVSNKIEKGT